MNDVGKRIKERRKQLGLSAEQVAAEMGVSPATIYRYESNYILNMGTDKLKGIAKVLKTTPEVLMGWGQIQQKNSTLTDLTVRVRTDETFCSVVEGLNQLDSVQLASVKQVVEAFLSKKD